MCRLNAELDSGQVPQVQQRRRKPEPRPARQHRGQWVRGVHLGDAVGADQQQAAHLVIHQDRIDQPNGSGRCPVQIVEDHHHRPGR